VERALDTVAAHLPTAKIGTEVRASAIHDYRLTGFCAEDDQVPAQRTQ
jgi:hypothetical protein